MIFAEMARLKNCWACDISSMSRGGSRTFKGKGGGAMRTEVASFLGGCGACSPRNF